ncbi:MAG: GMC family oxidoreductase [Anaerolineae bacterium]|nr:GMC family oxidoreductase [Anaerolineae bacterium]
MFKIYFKTIKYRPDLQVTIRSQQIQGWQEDFPGDFEDDAWVFTLDEDLFANGMEFKFVLEEQLYMMGNNLAINPIAGGGYNFDDIGINFPPVTEAIVENGVVQQKFFPPNLNEDIVYDVIVIGSGIGGGVVAEQAADLGLSVLILELGSYLFPTHVGDLPRQHQIAKTVDKHIWSLWDDFKVTNYVNGPGSQYYGGQGFCLGGRSVFWGGFIPRMTWWEMDLWPQDVRWYLEDSGYNKAERLLKKSLLQSDYQTQVLRYFERNFRDFVALTAPMSNETTNRLQNNVAAGIFSTADLLMESRLTGGQFGAQNLTINLNHAVTELLWEGDKVTGVVAYDLIADKSRTYRSQMVVLSAGTIESAKIAQLSNLKNPHQLIGTGITDHPIYYTHFALPNSSELYQADSSAKFMLRHRNAGESDQANQPQHRFNVLIELGADFNQGRYVDPDILDAMQAAKGNSMLCEIVFLFNTPLVETNQLTQNGPSYYKPVINMQPGYISPAEWAEIGQIKQAVLQALGAEALPFQNLDLKQADLGGVAHEVGTLRLGTTENSVVDTQLKFRGYDNLYVCDLSVFPASPAANPTLTLTALALRLSDHLRERFDAMG